jgi:hypothetical protein
VAQAYLEVELGRQNVAKILKAAPATNGHGAIEPEPDDHRSVEVANENAAQIKQIFGQIRGAR